MTLAAYCHHLLKNIAKNTALISTLEILILFTWGGPGITLVGSCFFFLSDFPAESYVQSELRIIAVGEGFAKFSVKGQMRAC